MKNILGKLALARTHIKSHPIKKDGKNTFSNYDYFTPELVGKMVSDACIETNIICLFNLKKDELGYYGELITTDMESGESLTTIMRTEKPIIKATNETQQMGGMNTYTKRYCLMSLFDIEDNNIDFDSDASKKNENKAETKTKNDDSEKPWLNEKDAAFSGAVEKLKAGKSSIAALRNYFKISKAIEEKLNAAIKQIPEPSNN